MVEKKSIGRRVAKLAAEHFVDGTAILAVATPALAAWENVAVGLSDQVSEGIRIDGAKITYLGAGLAFSKGREGYYWARNKIREKLGLQEKEPSFALHDPMYAFLYGVPVNTALSLYNGVPLQESITTGVGNSVICAGLGYGFGLAIETGRDLVGLEESKRLPLGIKKMSRIKKLALGSALVAASIGATKGVYESTPEGFKGVIKMVMPEKERAAESSLEKSLE